jgi:DNA-binding PadR family transcriptional regulator
VILGGFEQTLLIGLARRGGQADATAIRAEIEAKTGRSVAAGALFTVMERLRERGLVTSRKSEPRRVRGGRRRKVYQLEPEGAQALAEAHREYVSLTSGVMPTVLEILQRGRGG